MGVIVMPVYVPFLATRGVGVADVLLLQSINSAAMLLFEIPTGYLCDVLGRRRTILIAAVLNLLGFAGFAVAQGFAGYAAVQVVLAAGLSLVSGADIALIYDVLDLQQADRTQRRRALSGYVAAQTLGEAGFGLLGAALAAWSMRSVGIATAMEAALPLLIAFSLPSGGHGRMDITLTQIRSATASLFRQPGLSLLFANMIVWGLSTFIAVWLLQPYWREQGIGLRWFGLLWAGTLVTVAIAGRLAPVLTSRIGPRGTLLVLTIAPVVAYAGMATFGGTAGVAAGFLFYVSRGLNSVNLTEAFNHHVPATLRATFNSVRSGAFRLCFMVVGPLAGWAVARFGLTPSLALLAGVFAVAFVSLGLPLLRRTPL